MIGRPDVVLRYANHPLVMRKIEAEFSADTCQRAAMPEPWRAAIPACAEHTRPSLSGVLVRVLGDEQQQSYFHDYVVAQHCRAFFVTGPRARCSQHGDERRVAARAAATL